MARSLKKVIVIALIALVIFGLVFTLIAWVMLRPESSETLDQIEDAAETSGVLPPSAGVGTAEAVPVVRDNTVERPSVVVQVRQTDRAIGIFDVVTNLQYMHALGGLLYLTDARNSLYLYRNGQEAEAMTPSRTYEDVISMDTVHVPGLDRPYVLLNLENESPSFVASEGATGQLPDASQAVFAGPSQFLLADYDERGRLTIYQRAVAHAYDSSKDVRVYQGRTTSLSALLLSANERFAFLQIDDEEGTAIATLELDSGRLERVVEEPVRVWLAPQGRGLLAKREQSGATFYEYVGPNGVRSSPALPPHNDLFAWNAEGTRLFTLAASSQALTVQEEEAQAIEDEYGSVEPGAVEPAVPVLGDQLWMLELGSGRETELATLSEPIFADEFFYDSVRRQLIYRDPQLKAIVLIPDIGPNN